MLEQSVVVDHREWLDASAEDLYGGDRLIPVVHEYTNESEQTFRVLVVDGRINDDDPIILSSFPLDHRINPLSTRAAQVKAKQRGGLVAISEIPGVTKSDKRNPFIKGAFQTSEQFFSAIFKQDFGPIAEAQIKAMIDILGLIDGQKIQLDGESLAADVIADMFRVISSGELGVKLEVTNVNFVEIINRSEKNKFKWAKSVLKNLVTIEEPFRQRYIEENTEINHGDALPFGEASRSDARTQMALRILQFPFAYAPALGVSRGIESRLEGALQDPLSESRARETLISIYRGKNSSVSDKDHSEHIAQSIELAGGNVRLVKLKSGKGNPTGVYHSHGFSLGRAGDLAAWQKKD